MNKYFVTIKYEFKDNTVYKISLLFNAVIFILIMYIMMNVWNYLYQDKGSYIVGYDYYQMIWYVIMTELIWFCTRSFILSYQISDEIRSGNICSYITKPYYYPMFILSRYLGEIAVKTIIFIPIGLLSGVLYLKMFPHLKVVIVICMLITFIMSIIINGIIRVLIGLTSFWVENTQPVVWLYEKLILIIGTIFPIELFSQQIQQFLKYTPIYVISYGPARLFVKFNENDFCRIIISQIIYVIIGYICIKIVYKKGKRRLNVNGG